MPLVNIEGKRRLAQTDISIYLLCNFFRNTSFLVTFFDHGFIRGVFVRYTSSNLVKRVMKMRLNFLSCKAIDPLFTYTVIQEAGPCLLCFGSSGNPHLDCAVCATSVRIQMAAKSGDTENRRSRSLHNEGNIIWTRQITINRIKFISPT